MYQEIIRADAQAGTQSHRIAPTYLAAKAHA